MDTPENRDIVAELLKCGAIFIPGIHPGSRIDEQQRAYILDREDIIRASEALSRVAWQSIDCTDKDRALKLRSNAVAALAVMLHAMRVNENSIL